MKYQLLGMWSVGLWMVMGSVGWGQLLDFDLRRNIPWRIGEVVPPKTPTKIVAIWTDAVLHQPGRPPTRGFGGRLMFYGPDESNPIKVDGTLVVYAFDEEGRSPTDVKPDRKYVFPPDQFARHYSKSKLGHSYSIWIPWDEVGGPRKEISLIARFIPKNGAAIVSGQSRQILPGVAPAEEAVSSAGPGSSGAGGWPSTSSMQAPRPTTPSWPEPPSQTPSSPSPAETAGKQNLHPHSILPEAPNISLPESSPSGLVPEAGVVPGVNPLRTTHYEELSAPMAAPTQTAPKTPGMRSATIPIPSPLIRPNSASSLPSYGPTPYGSTVRPNPGTVPAAEVPAGNPEEVYSRASNRTSWPTPDTPSTPTGPQRTRGISYPDGVGAGGSARDSAQAQGQTGRWTPGRPLIRSGPIGPQAPAGAIGPQARDRAGLPPLP